jgi:hypothetical protein
MDDILVCYGSTRTVSWVLEFKGFYPVGNVPVTFKKVVCSQFDCRVVVNKFLDSLFEWIGTMWQWQDKVELRAQLLVQQVLYTVWTTQ